MFGAIWDLLEFYSKRPDLQKEFPEVIDGNLSGLLNWATYASQNLNKDKEAFEFLKKRRKFMAINIAILADQADVLVILGIPLLSYFISSYVFLKELLPEKAHRKTLSTFLCISFFVSCILGFLLFNFLIGVLSGFEIIPYSEKIAQLPIISSLTKALAFLLY